MKNWGQNVFEGLSVGAEEGGRLVAFLNANDFAPGTRDGYVFDLRKFARWFSGANHEPLTASRVTTRDITDFRTYLHRERQQAVATVNRSLVLIRRYFQWLADQGHIPTNPAKAVKELRRQMLAPKGLERPQVRRLLREAELRGDVRANAIFNLMLFSGCRVSDAINIDLADLVLGEKSGSVVYRYGKGNKQRTVPLPLPARRAIAAYLEVRPPVEGTSRMFLGERGPLTARGIRAICDKYSALTGVAIHPHALRHTFAHQFLADNSNDLVSLAQICGWENLQTAMCYTRRTTDQLSATTERVTY